MEGSVYAVLQSSSNPISMEQLTDEFIHSFVIDNHQPTEVVEVESISSALCVFKNYGGPSHSYFCAPPQRKWGCYFGQKITRYQLVSDGIHEMMIDDKPNPSSPFPFCSPGVLVVFHGPPILVIPLWQK